MSDADRKLYYEEPSLTRLETSVVDVGDTDGRPWVRLAATVFYPEGGGQPPDAGTIDGVRVVDVQSRGRQVLHFVERPLPADRVTLVLDAARRFDHCQQHTAQHLLTAIVADRHDRATTSFHLGERVTAIEIEGPPPPLATLRAIEDEVNERIRADLPVRAHWVRPEELGRLKVRTRGLPEGHEGAVRLVEIEGLDCNACGGTHVSRLGEIQMVHLLNASPARGGTRLQFLAGGRVLGEMLRLRALESDLKAKLGTGPEGFGEVLDGWEAQRRETARRVRDLEAALAARVGEELAAATGPIATRWLRGSSASLLRAVAGVVAQRRPEAIVCLVGEESGEACFLVQAGPEGPEDITSLGERLRQALGSKGGGRGRVYQGRGGRWQGDEATLERIVRGGSESTSPGSR